MRTTRVEVSDVDVIGNKYKRGPLNPAAAWHEVGAFSVAPPKVHARPSIASTCFW